ncbi:DUF551 domain-containing protein [Orrella sp. 11846]|uniref:DUF551 domain-containing protein n=1 Tax=Orrella sp. 11846 TaxID=3409913 RepID=UPI003B5CC7C5
MKNEWISVNQKLPVLIGTCGGAVRYSAPVLVFMKHVSGNDSNVAVLRYYLLNLDGNNKTFWGCEPVNEVTHWMPLPRAPKGNQHDY